MVPVSNAVWASPLLIPPIAQPVRDASGPCGGSSRRPERRRQCHQNCCRRREHHGCCAGPTPSSLSPQAGRRLRDSRTTSRHLLRRRGLDSSEPPCSRVHCALAGRPVRLGLRPPYSPLRTHRIDQELKHCVGLLFAKTCSTGYRDAEPSYPPNPVATAEVARRLMSTPPARYGRDLTVAIPNQFQSVIPPPAKQTASKQLVRQPSPLMTVRRSRGVPGSIQMPVDSFQRTLSETSVARPRRRLDTCLEQPWPLVEIFRGDHHRLHAAVHRRLGMFSGCNKTDLSNRPA